MIKTQKTLISLITLLFLTSGNAWAEKTLNADEVKKLFSGFTVESHHLIKDYNASQYYDPNGTFYGIRDDEISQGKWSVNDEGNLCMTFANGNTKCRIIGKEGDTYYKSKVKGNGDLKRLMEYKSFTKGNPKGHKYTD